jgi:6-phosphogluconolactonase (cycloisomerase 2 family)
MKAMHLRTAVLALLVVLAASCGGGNSTMMPPGPACVPASPPEFAYVLNGDTVSMYTVNSCNGSLTPTMPATVATGSSQMQPTPEEMVADPLGRFAYVANLVSNATDAATISMYAINPMTGVLTPTTPATVPTGFFPQGIGIDPAGKFVYTANSDDNTVSMFTINQMTGVLTPTTPPAVAAGNSPDAVTVDPTGRFAYAANQDDDTISMYNINPTTGVLTPMTPATVFTGGSPFQVTVSPNGKFAYVPNEGDDTVTGLSQYTIDSATGVLTPNNPEFVATGNQPTGVAVDPSSKFTFVVNRMDDSVSMYTIDPTTGNLTPNGIAGTGGEPFRIVVDPSGQFVYVANEDAPLSIFTLGTNGTLTSAGMVVTGNSAALSVAVTGAATGMKQ